MVATGVRYLENEDLNALAADIIHVGLGLQHIKIVCTKQMSTWQNGKGLVKIEVDNSAHVAEIVQNKRRLANCENEDIRSIYLQPSKSTETLVNERNQDLMLKLIGQHDQFRRRPDGTLTAKVFNGTGYYAGGRRHDWAQCGRGGFRSYSFNHSDRQSNGRYAVHRAGLSLRTRSSGDADSMNADQ